MSVLKVKRKASQFEVYHLYKEEVEKWHRTTQSH